MLKSKRQGDEAEDELLEHLDSLGLSAQKNMVHSLRYHYDVECSIPNATNQAAKAIDFRMTFEVKNDIMATKTGNVAIEYHNSRKNEPSGVEATQATFWVHKINGELWICSVAKLKQFIQDAIPFKTIKSGGDKNANLYIYRVDDFVKNCTRIKELKNENDFLSLL